MVGNWARIMWSAAKVSLNVRQSSALKWTQHTVSINQQLSEQNDKKMVRK